jgi:hypothetical protein
MLLLLLLNMCISTTEHRKDLLLLLSTLINSFLELCNWDLICFWVLFQELENISGEKVAKLLTKFFIIWIVLKLGERKLAYVPDLIVAEQPVSI